MSALIQTLLIIRTFYVSSLAVPLPLLYLLEETFSIARSSECPTSFLLPAAAVFRLQFLHSLCLFNPRVLISYTFQWMSGIELPALFLFTLTSVLGCQCSSIMAVMGSLLHSRRTD